MEMTTVAVGWPGDICPILHHCTGVGLESFWETVGQPAGSEHSDRVVVK
jgi:hypothetical protein